MQCNMLYLSGWHNWSAPYEKNNKIQLNNNNNSNNESNNRIITYYYTNDYW